MRPGRGDALMQFPHFLSPEEARIATAAGFGSFVFLMITRNLGWVYVLTLFVVGQITAYYFTIPVTVWFGWSMNAYGVAAFMTGAFAMLFWGAVIHLAQKLHDDPMGTLGWAWRLWRGGAGGDPKSGDTP
jgi:hypothetical protein